MQALYANSSCILTTGALAAKVVRTTLRREETNSSKRLEGGLEGQTGIADLWGVAR